MVANVFGYDKPFFHGYQAFVYGIEKLVHFCSRSEETLEDFVSRVCADLKFLGGHAEVCLRKFNVNGSLMDLIPVWESLRVNDQEVID